MFSQGAHAGASDRIREKQLTESDMFRQLRDRVGGAQACGVAKKLGDGKGHRVESRPFGSSAVVSETKWKTSRKQKCYGDVDRLLAGH